MKLKFLKHLSKSNKKINPWDFYQHILNACTLHFNAKLNTAIPEKSKECYVRLLNSGITRKNIKPIIMTKPYNAKDKTLVKYVKERLTVDSYETVTYMDENNLELSYKRAWYKVDANSTYLINYEDIEILVQSINEILYINYPKIKQLLTYLKEMVKILNKLDLPVIWNLPHGLTVIQKYMKRHTKKIKPYTYLPNSLNITITDKVELDKNKQLLAFMPNLVHSLDSYSLITVFDSFSQICDKNTNLYGVHDCYGVTAPHLSTLIELLRLTYVDLYSNEGYIKELDNCILNYISNIFGDSCNVDKIDRTLIINNQKYKLPSLPNNINLSQKKEVYESLQKSIYHIS